MQTTFSLPHVVSSFLLGATLAASAQAQPDYTELISPEGRSDGQFGARVGGLPDLTRDGVDEFYVFSRDRTYVYDGDKLTLLYTLRNLGCFLNRTQTAGDLTGDGIPELMAADACTGDFSGRVRIFDGANGAVMFSLTSPNPQSNDGRFGNDLRLLPDMTGDGKEDWLIHQLEVEDSAAASRPQRFYRALQKD